MLYRHTCARALAARPAERRAAAGSGRLPMGRGNCGAAYGGRLRRRWRLAAGIERHAPLAEELRNVLHRVVRLPGERAALGRSAERRTARPSDSPRPARRADARSTISSVRHLAQETTTAWTAPARRRRTAGGTAPRSESAACARASCPRSTAAALLPAPLRNSSTGCAGTVPSSIPARNTTGNSSPLALCSVIRVTGARLVHRVGVGHQRRVIQKIADASRRAPPLPPPR